MIRTLGAIGLGVVFLTISPALREGLVDAIHAVEQTIVAYSPLSYLTVAVMLLVAMAIGVHRAARPRV